MKKIKLSRNEYALVDDEDFEILNKKKWYFNPAGSKGYAAHDDKNGRVLMHRVIIGAKKDELVDHINRNSLDNRKSNLRIADKSLNGHNSKLRSDSTSGVKGVGWHKQVKMWRAYIQVRGKAISLGVYHNISDAIKARKAAEVLWVK